MEAVQTLRIVLTGKDVVSSSELGEEGVEAILFFTDKTARDWSTFNHTVTEGHHLISGSLAITGEANHRYELRHHYLLIRRAGTDNIGIAIQGDDPASWVPLVDLPNETYQAILKASTGKWELSQFDSQRRAFEAAIENTLTQADTPQATVATPA